ncbi:hypothetical protein [Saccharopolyspora hirsuta]|nr:hypothetical protein [Saccharopolyspora hirsuta]
MKLDAEAAEPEEDLSDERMALEDKQAELQCEVDRCHGRPRGGDDCNFD